MEKQILEEGRRLFEKHKAEELQRQKQQGFGRPIISIEHQGYRFVAVANKLHYGKWKSFPDFLTYYIKHTLNGGWGNAEIAKPLADRHPILQWYDKVCRVQAVHAKEPGVLFSTPMTGAVSAYNRLAYNLYLIAHSSKDIQTKLIARLKNRDNFQGAFFETQVAAWLIKAGYELEFEDGSDRSSTHCEFTATYKSTEEKYSVEAKSRSLEFTRSSRAKVGRKLYEALEKKANHKRLVFLDLNKPLHTREAADLAFDRAERILAQSEGLKIDGSPAPAAYVCITNMNDQYYAKHPETYFGVYQQTARKVDTAMEMFDFFVDGYRNTPKERLIELLPNYPDQESIRRMPQKDLVEILAEGYTMSMVAKGFASKPLRKNPSRKPGSE